MVSTSHLKDHGEDTFKSEELILSNSDPQIKHLNTFWDICFEQCEPPTEDKATQIKDDLYSTLLSTQKDFDAYKISCKAKFSMIDKNEISILKTKINNLENI